MVSDDASLSHVHSRFNCALSLLHLTLGEQPGGEVIHSCLQWHAQCLDRTTVDLRVQCGRDRNTECDQSRRRRHGPCELLDLGLVVVLNLLNLGNTEKGGIK